MWEFLAALATAVQLHVKWSWKHKSQLQTAQRLMFLLNSEWAYSFWYDGTRHVRRIRNFRIGTPLSNQIRIGTSDSNSNRISKRSLFLNQINLCSFEFELCYSHDLRFQKSHIVNAITIATSFTLNLTLNCTYTRYIFQNIDDFKVQNLFGTSWVQNALDRMIDQLYCEL